MITIGTYLDDFNLNILLNLVPGILAMLYLKKFPLNLTNAFKLKKQTKKKNRRRANDLMIQTALYNTQPKLVRKKEQSGIHRKISEFKRKLNKNYRIN